MLNHIPVYEPPGYAGPKMTAADLERQREAEGNLTPAQIVAMTPAQRAAAHIESVPGPSK